MELLLYRKEYLCPDTTGGESDKQTSSAAKDSNLFLFMFTDVKNSRLSVKTDIGKKNFRILRFPTLNSKNLSDWTEFWTVVVYLARKQILLFSYF